MIQIIKKEYRTIDEAIKDINIISINYDYFTDYDIITFQTSYIVLLKFNVPEDSKYISTLDLAKIKSEGSFNILNFKYNIELTDKELEAQTWSKSINCNVFNDRLIEITAHFGIKDFIDIVRFEYIDDGIFKGKYIEVSLNEFEFSSYLWGCSSKKRQTFVCDNVDYKVIYEHINNVYLQRGYLLNRDGLKDFKETLQRVCDLINKRKIGSSQR